jgi:hypothetical protein
MGSELLCFACKIISDLYVVIVEVEWEEKCYVRQVEGLVINML